jgi:hypothetical protein
VLDGPYIIRTSVPKKQMNSAEAARSYKALAEVERAFRSMNTIDLHIPPIPHHREGRETLVGDEGLERKKHRKSPPARSKTAHRYTSSARC